MATPTFDQLLEAGCHFGHLKRKWNPAMAPYIFMERNGIHIIDLYKTVAKIDEAAAALRQMAKAGKKVLFVATKKQAKEAIEAKAGAIGMPYVIERWPGGMLTNFPTIRKAVKKMTTIDKMTKDGTFDNLSKREKLQITRQRAKLEKNLGSIADLSRLPSALFVVDVNQEHISGQPVRVNKTRLQAHKGLYKLTSTGTSFSYTFNNSTFKKKDKKDDKHTRNGRNDDYDEDYDDEDDDRSLADMAPSRKRRGNREEEKQNDADGYTPWECPWSLTFNYSVNYGLGDFNYQKMDYNGRFTQNLSVSGNIRPTKNWNFSMSCSYDFQAKKIAYMNCNISRDMHCFTMSCSIIPVGVYKSFNFNVAVKSSLLSDLKYDKQSSRLNGITW